MTQIKYITNSAYWFKQLAASDWLYSDDATAKENNNIELSILSTTTYL